MRLCAKCGKPFPKWIKVDGVWKSIAKRTSCLECNPYKSGKRLKMRDETEIELTCGRCGRNFKYSRANRQGHTKTLCNSCHVNVRRFHLKEKAIKYKGGKCINCGYNRCIGALEFHHLQPTKKNFQISGNHARSWEVLKTELDKTILVCANCRREIEAGLLDTSKLLAKTFGDTDCLAND